MMDRSEGRQPGAGSTDAPQRMARDDAGAHGSAAHAEGPRRSSSYVRVRYAETDQMGVVYHANYLVWCEIGRTDFIRALGTSYADLERQGLRLAVADAQARFIAPARYDDEIRIETWVERVQSRTITFGYEIFRVDPGPEQRLVRASTRLIALDEQGAPRTLPTPVHDWFRSAAEPSS